MDSHNNIIDKLESIEDRFNLEEFVDILKEMYLTSVTKQEYDDLLDRIETNIYTNGFNRFSFHRYFRGRLNYSVLLHEIEKIKEEEEDFF